MSEKQSLYSFIADNGLSSHQERLEHDIECAADIIIRRAAIHLGSVQKRSVSKKHAEHDIMAEAIKFLAFELYHRNVSVKITNSPSRPDNLRFIVDCERGNFPMQVFPLIVK